METLYANISNSATAAHLSCTVSLASGSLRLPTHLRRRIPARTVPVQGSRSFQWPRAHVDHLSRPRQWHKIGHGHGAGRRARDEVRTQSGREDLGRIRIHHWRPAQRVASRPRAESAPARSGESWPSGREGEVRTRHRTRCLVGRLGGRQAEGEERQLVPGERAAAAAELQRESKSRCRACWWWELARWRAQHGHTRCGP